MFSLTGTLAKTPPTPEEHENFIGSLITNLFDLLLLLYTFFYPATSL